MKVIKLQSNERIKSKYLRSFILTNLQNKNIKLTSKNRVYSSFIEKLNLYQVFIFEKQIPFVFFYEAKTNLELLIAKDFFVLYKDFKLYYYEELENLNIEDICLYINKTLGLSNLKISYIEDIILNKDTKYEFLQIIKPKLFKFFILYLLLLASFFYFFENKKQTTSFNEFTNSFESNKKHIEYKYLSKMILKLQNRALKYNIKIISIEYREFSFFVSFISSKQEEFNSFLKSFKTYKLERIEKKDKKRLLANVYFKLD